ncbi:helix-turn-helix domain-containing protein [Saliphagus sp. LR7]|uniref:AlbA family DNA-binding domain-containing protein n=1 Tax=Saliphagus sp. LR7 TaxID=2282654 RepID=UPI0013008E0E|nr:ATP-binding protein [Saliphagus sp. LR7]
MIERFGSQPGVESENIDFKSKEILERKDGRKKVIKVLSGMANQSGGTVIVGVRKEQENGLRIQGFSIDSEAKLHLTQLALEYTRPPLNRLLEFQFVDYSGESILRIDVNRATRKPIEFKVTGDYEPWIRVGDSTEPMTTEQIVHFFNRWNKAEISLYTSDIEQRVDLNFDVEERSDPPEIRSPENWFISTCHPGSLFVFGPGGLEHEMGKSVLYHVDSRLYASTVEEISDVLELAERLTNISLDHSTLGYTIKLGECQAMARDHRWFLEDLDNIQEVESKLEQAHNYDESQKDILFDSNLTAVAYTTHPYGIFWIETQWREDQFTPTKCGYVFTDIPVDDSPYREFFSELEQSPGAYKQQSGLQLLTMLGDPQYLANPREIDLSAYPGAANLICVDNPLYGRAAKLMNETTPNLPEHFAEPLSSVNRLPLDVTGGVSLNRDDVVLEQMSVFSKGIAQNTLFVSGLCRRQARTNVQ